MYARFEELLKLANTTAYKVALSTGVSKSTLSDWKHGRSTPKYEALSKIAEHFGVTVEYLTGKSDEKRHGYTSVSDEDLKIALFGGENEITDEMWQEIKQFAEFVKMKYGK